MNDATNPEALSLCNDMTCILVECHRDRLGDGVFRADVNQAALTELAALLARRLAPRIGGRYIPKRDVRAERDFELWGAFTGNNHKELMKKFGISRRLVYSILARQPRGFVSSAATRGEITRNAYNAARRFKAGRSVPNFHYNQVDEMQLYQQMFDAALQVV